MTNFKKMLKRLKTLYKVNINKDEINMDKI